MTRRISGYGIQDMALTLEELKSVLASSERVKAALMKQAGW